MDASEADAGGVNPTFRRKCERAFFTLTEAERLGVRFHFSLEADYPPDLSADCVCDLERAIGADRVLIAKLIMERAGVAP
jgi:hypothetical protein